MKITKMTYNLYLKHGSELLWVSDPLRNPRPKGTTEQTDNAFDILERLDENMDLFYNANYSQKMKNESVAIVEQLKSLVTDEVFELIEKKYKK